MLGSKRNQESLPPFEPEPWGTWRHFGESGKLRRRRGDVVQREGSGNQKFSLGLIAWELSFRYSTVGISYVIKGLNLRIIGEVTV